jgi:uncharacterized protein YlxW (UPF0749 family)
VSAVVITAVAVLGILLTVAGVIGVWLAMRTAQHTQTVKNFRDAAESWREKAEATDSELTSMRTEMTELRQQYTSLLQKHEALQDVVTGRTAIENLGVQVGDAQSAIIAEIRQNRDLLHALSPAS